MNLWRKAGRFGKPASEGHWRNIVATQVLDYLLEGDIHVTPVMYTNLCRRIRVGECSTRQLVTYLCYLHPELWSVLPAHLFKETE